MSWSVNANSVKIRLASSMTIFNSLAEFVKWSPVASDFVKTLTNELIHFLFESVNIEQPKSAFITNKSMS